MQESEVAPEDAADGSMETILASIRRIIREDEAAPSPGDDASKEDEDDLLVLQPSMMVQPVAQEEAAMTIGAYPPGSAASSAADLAAALFDDPPATTAPKQKAPAATPPVAAAPSIAPPILSPPVDGSFACPLAGPAAAAHVSATVSELVLPRPTRALGDADDSLLAPETRFATVQSLAALQEAVRPGPPELRLLRQGGPTIEDMVREELRSQLKLWLDENLPSLVERLVRQEIEQMVRSS